MSKTIPLSQGLVAIVDDEDYEALNQWIWSARVGTTVTYAARYRRKEERGRGASYLVYMHREILGLGKGSLDERRVDHINHDGLDNRKANLRIATSRENSRNQRKFRGTSRYKGVAWYKPYDKWHASIGIEGTQKHIGYYTSEEEAAHAYDEVAQKIYGEFAVLNFPA